MVNLNILLNNIRILYIFKNYIRCRRKPNTQLLHRVSQSICEWTTILWRNPNIIRKKKEVFVCIQTISNRIVADNNRQNKNKHVIDAREYVTPKKESGRYEVSVN